MKSKDGMKVMAEPKNETNDYYKPLLKVIVPIMLQYGLPSSKLVTRSREIQ